MFLIYSTTVGSAAPQIPTAGGSLAEIRTRDLVGESQERYQPELKTWRDFVKPMMKKHSG